MQVKTIDSPYVATSMSGLVVGEDLKKLMHMEILLHVDKVASPDNLSYSEAMRTLFIGEDSSKHTNNLYGHIMLIQRN